MSVESNGSFNDNHLMEFNRYYLLTFMLFQNFCNLFILRKTKDGVLKNTLSILLNKMRTGAVLKDAWKLLSQLIPTAWNRTTSTQLKVTPFLMCPTEESKFKGVTFDI